MIKSMTGFGRGNDVGEKWQVSIEMKSVNSRYLEISTKIPKQLISLEERAKRLVGEVLKRGRVDIFLVLEEIGEKNHNLKVDKELALAYYNAVQEIADLCGLDGKPTLDNIAAFYGVLNLEKKEADVEEIWVHFSNALKEALEQLLEMRVVEGARLAADIEERIGVVEDIRVKIEDRSPLVVHEYREKLHLRMKEILGDIELDEAKLLNEVAFFADRGDIAEELTRLNSHLTQFKADLKKGGSVGRKMDFLLQEINREVNTIGSKANDMSIGRLVIEAKSELEKIREQVQNLE